MIEDSITARLMGQDSQLDTIDKFILEGRNGELKQALDERVGKNYLKNFTPQEEFIIQLISKHLISNPKLLHKIQNLYKEGNPIFNPTTSTLTVDEKD